MLYRCFSLKKTALCFAVVILSILTAVLIIINYKSDAKTVSQSVEGTPLPIIMYHQITDNPSKKDKYVVSCNQLEEDFKYIKQNGYTAITAAELYEYISENKPLPQKPIIITFDDGCESFLTYAVPLLEKYDLKAVMSIVGSFTDKFTQTEDHNIRYSCLNWHEVRQLDQSGRVEIANHTYDMHSNSGGRKGASQKKGESEQTYRDALSNDIGRMQKLLEEQIGKPAQTFTFPYGAMSKSSRIIVSEMGFNVIFTCEERVNIITNDISQLKGLGRYNRSGNYSTQEFFSRFE